MVPLISLAWGKTKPYKTGGLYIHPKMLFILGINSTDREKYIKYAHVIIARNRARALSLSMRQTKRKKR